VGVVAERKVACRQRQVNLEVWKTCMTAVKVLARVTMVLLMVFTAVFTLPVRQAAADPYIHINLLEGTVGTRIIVSGTGLTPSVAGNATVAGTTTFAKTYFPDKTTLVKSTAIDYSGNFETDLTIGEYPAGVYKLWVYDASASPPKWAGVSFTILPQIFLSASSDFHGENITISGNGFAASANATIYFDTIAVKTFVTIANGTVNQPDIPVPPSPRGSHDIKVVDIRGNESVQSFETIQRIEISPSSGPFGSKIAVAGASFAPDALITLTMNSLPAPTSPSLLMTGLAGNFSGVFYMPAYAVGTYNIEASDGTNRAATTVELTFGGQINRVVGYPGSKGSYTGSGFIPGRVAILRFDGNPMSEATVGPQGNLRAEFVIPPSAEGKHTILVTDGTSNTTHTFMVYSQASSALNRDTGSVGNEITFSGTGLIPEKIVTVKYDSSPVAEVKVDDDGTFTSDFKVPAGVGGAHIISTSDGICTVNQTFTLETVPPLAPSLLAPENKSSEKTLQGFSWKGVEDPSGVTYTFQLARDTSFGSSNITSLLVSKSGLTQTGFSPEIVLEAAKKPETYYWRVRATDLASNAGPWSETRSFIIPAARVTWFRYTIIAEGVFFVAFMGMWIVRKRRG
jgi:hypothetical protein